MFSSPPSVIRQLNAAERSAEKLRTTGLGSGRLRSCSVVRLRFTPALAEKLLGRKLTRKSFQKLSTGTESSVPLNGWRSKFCGMFVEYCPLKFHSQWKR